MQVKDVTQQLLVCKLDRMESKSEFSKAMTSHFDKYEAVWMEQSGRVRDMIVFYQREI